MDGALRTIDAVVTEEAARHSIVSQTVFVADPEWIGECREAVREFYGEHVPATFYIPQRPCDGKLVAIEAMAVGGGPGRVEIERHGEHVTVVRHGGVAWTHVSQATAQTRETGVYARSLDAFEQMRRMLADRNVPFEQIIRTWLYLGDIVGAEGSTQRYMELNRARADVYENVRFLAKHVLPGVTETIYPASTGIGTDIRDLILGGVAVTTKRDDLVIQPLENPLQTSAFDYMASYGPKSPKFSRAMALTAGDCATFFISGTASITQSESQYAEDVDRQTHQTLDNIAALIAEQNTCHHGLRGRGATLRDLALARVYVKHQRDYQKIRQVCEERLGPVPVLYTVADVCRPELLVEIEGIAFSTHGAR